MMRTNPRNARKPLPPSANRLSPEAVFRAGGENVKPAMPRPDVGPRPLSPSQRALLDAKSAPPLSPTQDTATATLPRSQSARGRTVHVRDGQTSRSVRRVNRKRRNIPRLLLGWASATLAVECVVVLLFSPRLAVRQVSVEGNRQISTAHILALAPHLTGLNLVRLPTGKVRQALLTEPTFEAVEVHRMIPASVRLVVHERQPWASVHLPDGRNVTIDEKLVPFRVTKGAEAGLPRLTLASATPDALSHVAPPALSPVTLGKPLDAPGLSEVSRCLAWARAQNDFKLASVEIDPAGKLCLNRVGNLQVRLGSGTDLEKKLKSLELLLNRRPDLQQGTQVAYVNLYAFDAPALGMRPPLPKGSEGMTATPDMSGTGAVPEVSDTMSDAAAKPTEITVPLHRARARRTTTGTNAG